MSSSEITPSEIISSEELSSKTASSTQKNGQWQFIIWIGLGVVSLVLLLIFKSFFSSEVKKENVIQNQSTVLSEENKLQVPQNIENKKTDDQLALPSIEPLPHIPEINKSNTSSSSIAEELPISPHISNDTASSVSPQIMSDEKTDIDTLNFQQISALENKIKDLEQHLKETENQKIYKSQIWTKFQQLKTALNESRSFESELQQFSALFSPQSKIAQHFHVLISYAKEGLPALDQLLQKFTVVKQEIVNYLKQQETGWRKVKWQLMPWMQIYNTQVTDSTSMSLWILLKLEEATMRQDMAQIIEIIKPLKQENLPIFNSWCTQVQNYQYLIKIKKDLFDQTISEIVQ